ncbi:MAG: SIMPL domain-containing protein [Flavobacteriales bacterium]|nr:SIMPL domain-containing protein [Flavobacteriales bacterium]
MGNLMYETNSRIFFQQAEQPVKASIQGNMLVLEVNAMMNMKADSYLAIFHITQLGQSAEEADSLMNARIDGFTQRVKEHGVKEKDVFPDMLSFVPVYEIETTRKLFSKTYQEVPAGFEIQKNIHVRFTDARILDRLVTAAAKEEIYDLVKVDFFVETKAHVTTHCACSPPSSCTRNWTTSQSWASRWKRATARVPSATVPTSPWTATPSTVRAPRAA